MKPEEVIAETLETAGENCSEIEVAKRIVEDLNNAGFKIVQVRPFFLDLHGIKNPFFKLDLTGAKA